jgi:DNA-directed RNA polymerase subunit RPC12/RpoP
MIVTYLCMDCKKRFKEETDRGSEINLVLAICKECSVKILRKHLDNNSIGGLGSGARIK